MVIAVMCAIAAASRVIIPIPHFKPIFAIIMLSGIAFGPEAGFMVGAISALASDMFYTQGAYLPWQMFAYGIAGLLAGGVYRIRRIPRKPWLMGIFGFFTCVLVVGPILDLCTAFLSLPAFTLDTLTPFLLSGITVNISQGACTFLTMLLFGNPLLEKLDRIKLKYGMMEGENGL